MGGGSSQKWILDRKSRIEGGTRKPGHCTGQAFNGKGSWTNCDTQAECIQNLELMGLEVKDMVGKQYLSEQELRQDYIFPRILH